MADKYVKDGQVGVLYSPGYGAGWSTWGGEELAYDKDLVQAFLEGGAEKLRKVATEKYPGKYQGGLSQIKLEWVPQGMAFRINEYDGYESIEYQSDSSFTQA